MTHQTKQKELESELDAKFLKTMRDMHFSELATEIFRPFRHHGIVFGTVYLRPLRRFAENLAYELDQLPGQKYDQKATVTLKQSNDGGVYVHFRAQNKKILNWGWRLFTMTQGRLERFEERHKEIDAAAYHNAMDEIAKFQSKEAARLAGCRLITVSMDLLKGVKLTVSRLVETAAREAFASGVLFAQQELDPRGGGAE
jgi:hypothetical protein